MSGFVVISENCIKKMKNDAKYMGVQTVTLRKNPIKKKPTNMDEDETSVLLFCSPNHSPTRGTWFLVDPAARCD